MNNKVNKKLPSKLPKSLQRYFWEVDFTNINPSSSAVYVINRLLDRGDLPTIKWVFTNFPKHLIIKTIQTRRDWQKKSINFWARYFKLKNEEVKCLNKDYLNQRCTHWPY